MIKHALFVCLVLLFGCLGQDQPKTIEPAGQPPVQAPVQSPQNTVESQLFDCGTDNNCFYTRALGCARVKGEINNSVDLFGIIGSKTSYYETKGIVNGKCTFYEKILKNSVAFSESLKAQLIKSGHTAEEIEAQLDLPKRQAAALEDRYSTCRYPIADFDKMITGWSKGSYSFSTGDWEKYECTGTMNSPEGIPVK